VTPKLPLPPGAPCRPIGGPGGCHFFILPDIGHLLNTSSWGHTRRPQVSPSSQVPLQGASHHRPHWGCLNRLLGVQSGLPFSYIFYWGDTAPTATGNTPPPPQGHPQGSPLLSSAVERAPEFSAAEGPHPPSGAPTEAFPSLRSSQRATQHLLHCRGDTLPTPKADMMVAKFSPIFTGSVPVSTTTGDVSPAIGAAMARAIFL
jgi:hypothetical protein